MGKTGLDRHPLLIPESPGACSGEYVNVKAAARFSLAAAVWPVSPVTAGIAARAACWPMFRDMGHRKKKSPQIIGIATISLGFQGFSTL
jgi:hypothetical protein